MTFQIILHDDVKRKIKRIPRGYQEIIISKLSALSEFPHFLDIKKVKGQASTYRLRIGNYRAVFDVDFSGKTIYVITLGVRGRTEY